MLKQELTELRQFLDFQPQLGKQLGSEQMHLTRTPAKFSIHSKEDIVPCPQIYGENTGTPPRINLQREIELLKESLNQVRSNGKMPKRRIRRNRSCLGGTPRAKLSRKYMVSGMPLHSFLSPTDEGVFQDIKQLHNGHSSQNKGKSCPICDHLLSLGYSTKYCVRHG